MINFDNINDRQHSQLTELASLSTELAPFKGKTLEEISMELPDSNLIKDMCNEGLGSIRIKDVGNNSESGFGAISFVDNQGNVGFSFRGTDSDGEEFIKDMSDNFETFIGIDSNQVYDAVKFYKFNKSGLGNNYLYGHSKGGELAQEIYVRYYNDIRKCRTINSQPINISKLNNNQRNALLDAKFIPFSISGDLVSRLGSGYDWYKSKIKHIKADDSVLEHISFPLNFLWPHLLQSSTYDENGNYVFDNDYVDTWIDIGLTILEIIIIWRHPMILPASMVLYLLVTVINSFVNWLDRIINPGSYYSEEHPFIEIDTYKLDWYARELRDINRRIEYLDQRIKQVYSMVGFLDLLHLINTDILIHNEKKLEKCAQYLNYTSNAFFNAENEVKSKLMNL